MRPLQRGGLTSTGSHYVCAVQTLLWELNSLVESLRGIHQDAEAAYLDEVINDIREDAKGKTAEELRAYLGEKAKKEEVMTERWKAYCDAKAQLCQWMKGKENA